MTGIINVNKYSVILQKQRYKFRIVIRYYFVQNSGKEMNGKIECWMLDTGCWMQTEHRTPTR